MSETNEKVEETQDQAPGGPPLREVSEEDLLEILEAHREWVESGGEQGGRADLSYCDLRGKDLKDADLRDADLTGATGLLAGQLARANLAGAKLPEDIQKFEALTTIDEASKNTKGIFLAMLLGCAYTALTIFSTTDARLLTNSASLPLPIIQTPIPIAGFFGVAPVILFAIYLYFHLYLQRLWEGLADLPAVFPDGRSLDKRAYPWLLNTLVRSNFALLKKDRPPLSRLQIFVSVFLAWWAVPFTIALIWLRYLLRHDWFGTALHIALLVVSVTFGFKSYDLARETLRGWGREQLSSKEDAWIGLDITYIVLIVMIIILFSVDVIVGEHVWYVADLTEQDVSIKPTNWTGQKEKEKEEIALVKGALLRGKNLRYMKAFHAFLVKADLRGADLRGANLRGADLREANLLGADLRHADLQDARLFLAKGLNLDQLSATYNWVLALYSEDLLKKLKLPLNHNEKIQKKDLRGADLRKKYLVGADLAGFNLQKANIQKVYLTGANLDGAILAQANLFDASLPNSNLRKTDLFEANLQGTLLDFANLEKANLRKANLQGANLFGANLQGARLDDANLQGVDLRKANLQGANLFGANLQGANLRGANLQEANLRGAELQGANLRGVKGLIGSQVEKATNWQLAFYSDLKKLGLPPDHNKVVEKKLAER